MSQLSNLCHVHVSEDPSFGLGGLPLYSVTSSSQRVVCGLVGELAAVVVDDEQEVTDMLIGLGNGMRADDTTATALLSRTG